MRRFWLFIALMSLTFLWSACDVFTSSKGGEGEGCLENGACKDGLTCNAESNICTDCGNNQLDFGEECDGAAMRDGDCADLGYHAGELTCTDACVYDLAACREIGQCSDDEVNGAEDCDGADLGVHTCLTLGYYGGQIACDDDCHYDLSDCEDYGKCGDRIVQAQYEECEPLNVGTSCLDLGFHGGVLICDSECTFDTTDCELYGYCGDGFTNGDEECDSYDELSTDCREMGFVLGQLCNEDCEDIDTCEGADGVRRVPLPDQCQGPLGLDLSAFDGKLLLAHGCTAGEAAVHEAPLNDPTTPFVLRKRLSRDNPNEPAPALVFGADGEIFAGDSTGDVFRHQVIAESDPLDWESTWMRSGDSTPQLAIDAMSYDPTSGALGLADLGNSSVETWYWPQPDSEPITHYLAKENFINPMLSMLVLSESETTSILLMGMDALSTELMGVIGRYGIRFEDLPSGWDTYEAAVSIADMAFQADSLFVAFAVDTGEASFIRLWDLDFYPWEPQPMTYGSARHSRVAFTLRSNDLIAGTEDGRLLLYESISSEPVLDLKIAEGPVKALAVSEDGTFAATWAEGDDFIQVWNLDVLYALSAGT